METITTALLLKLLAMAAALGIGSKLTHWLLDKLPAVNVHTKSELLNKILDTVGNAAEDVVKTALSGDDVDALVTALAGGATLPGALGGLLPALTGKVADAAGPVAVAALGKLLGTSEAASARIEQAVVSACHDIWTAHKAAVDAPKPGTVVQLSSGHLLVVPSGGSVPAGAQAVPMRPAV